MADDIVTRLQCAYPSGEWPCESCTFCAARAEIERLRAKRDAEHDLADQLASHLEWALRCVGSLPLEMRATFDARMAEVLAAHKEARRG